MPIVTTVVVTLAAALLLLSLDGSGVLSAQPDTRGAASSKLDPTRHDVAQQWRDFAASDALACLGETAASRATTAMNTAMRQARRRALAERVDPRSATHAAARSSLVLIADQSYDTACRDKLEKILESAYADAMSRLEDRPSVWRGAVLGDLVAEQSYGHSPTSFLRRCARSCRIETGW